MGSQRHLDSEGYILPKADLSKVQPAYDGLPSFAVVMARDGVWATVLEEQAAVVGAALPRWEQAARHAAEQGRRPVAEPAVVSELLETFGRWAEEALARIAAQVVNAEASEGGHGS